MTDMKTSKTQKRKFTLPILIIALLAVSAAYILLTNTNGNSEVLNNKNMNKPEQIHFTKEGELTFQTPDEKFKCQIDVELATDDIERAIGLMYREHMDEDQGMLFIFPKEEYQSFWMRNTVLSLDILYVNKNREIVTIHKNAVPFSEESLPSTEPAIYVVEVNAGFTTRHNISEGDKISWRVL